jgi:hypothetical protein
MRRPPRSVQILLLMPLAAWSVHQLRYLLAYGPTAGRELSAQGHAYLSLLVPVFAGLAAMALGAAVLRLRAAWQGGGRAAAPRLGIARLWAVAAAGLLTIYIGQELLEGALATGHAAGIAGVFADGGWLAAPAAMLAGGLIAALLRGAGAVEVLVCAYARRRAMRPRRLVKRAAPSPVALPPQAPLARLGAGRAPPAARVLVQA